MANQIGDFFAAWPDRQLGRDEIASHFERFWDPRMRAQIIAHVESTGGEGLEGIVVEAIAQLKVPHMVEPSH